jgi:type II secretory pathway pseudopilin PulG
MEESSKKILLSVLVIVIIAGLMLFLFLSYMRQLQLAAEQNALSASLSDTSETTDTAVYYETTVP